MLINIVKYTVGVQNFDENEIVVAKFLNNTNKMLELYKTDLNNIPKFTRYKNILTI